MGVTEDEAGDFKVEEDVSKAEVGVTNNAETDSTAGHMGTVSTLVINVINLPMATSPPQHLIICKMEVQGDVPENLDGN